MAMVHIAEILQPSHAGHTTDLDTDVTFIIMDDIRTCYCSLEGQWQIHTEMQWILDMAALYCRSS